MVDNAQREHRTGLAKILEQARRAQTKLDERGEKKNLWMLAEMDRQQDDQNFEEAEQGQKIQRNSYQNENLI